VSKPTHAYDIRANPCSGLAVCPLTQVKAGTVVCIKQLAAGPEMCVRLREMGLGEDQRVKLVSSHANFICQVCNARLGLSESLAAAILVEPVPSESEAA
jgi:ferrous iron transport protein A